MGIAVVDTEYSLDTTAIITACRPSARILIRQTLGNGHAYRFLHTTRSWFDGVTPFPPRFDLRPLAEALNHREAVSEGRWFADPKGAPVAELSFGQPIERSDPTKPATSPRRSLIPPDALLQIIEAAAAEAATAP